MKPCFLVPLCLLLVLAPALAQPAGPQREVFAGAGVCPAGNGNAPCVLGGLGFPLGARASLELNVLHAPVHRQPSETSFRGVTPWFELPATQALLNYVRRWRSGRTRVLALAGIGYATSVERQAHVYGTAGDGVGEFVTSDSINGIAWGLGTGLEIFLSPRLSLRPQVGFSAGPAGDEAWARAQATAAMGYHW